MEKIHLDTDIKVLYVKAATFPDGIPAAWQKLHALLPTPIDRKQYGISHGSADGILYMAAAEERTAGEAERLGCGSYIIPAGDYIRETLDNWKQHVTKIASTFQTLLRTPGIDPLGFCLEIYTTENDNVDCLVKLQSK